MSIAAPSPKPKYPPLTKEQFLIAKAINRSYKSRSPLIQPHLVDKTLHILHSQFYVLENKEGLFLKVTVESGPQGICYQSDSPHVFSSLTSRFQTVHHCVLSMLQDKDNFSLVEESKISPSIKSTLPVMNELHKQLLLKQEQNTLLKEQHRLLATLQEIIPQSKTKIVNGYWQVTFFDKSSCKIMVLNLNVRMKEKVEFFTTEQHKDSLAKIIQKFKTESDALVDILTNTNHFVLLNWKDASVFEILEAIAKLFENERNKIRLAQIEKGIVIEFRVSYTDLNTVKIFKIEIHDDGSILLGDPQTEQSVLLSLMQKPLFLILEAIFKGLPNCLLLDFNPDLPIAPLEEKKMGPVINLNKIDKEQHRLLSILQKIPQSKIKIVNDYWQVVFFDKSNCKIMVLNVRVKDKVEFFTAEQNKGFLAKIVQQFKTECDALVDIFTNTNHFILLNWKDDNVFEILEAIAKLFENERKKIRLTQIEKGIAIEFKVGYTDNNLVKVFKIKIHDDGSIFLCDEKEQFLSSSVEAPFISILNDVFKGLIDCLLLDFDISNFPPASLEEKKMGPIINLNKIDKEQQEFVNCINDLYDRDSNKIKIDRGESDNWIVKIVICFEAGPKSEMFIFDIHNDAKFFLKEGDRFVVLSNSALNFYCKIMRGEDPSAILRNFKILQEFPENKLPFNLDHYQQYPAVGEIYNVIKNLFNKDPSKFKLSSADGTHAVNFKFFDAIKDKHIVVGFLLSKEGKLLLINEERKLSEADQDNTQYLSNMLRGWIKNYSLVDFEL